MHEAHGRGAAQALTTSSSPPGSSRPLAPWGAAGVALVVAACQTDPGLPSAQELAAMVQQTQTVSTSHEGPAVELMEGGTRRFAGTLYNAFREERAMETVRFMDARYRTPGSEGFQQALEAIERDLRAAGFGRRAELELEILETELERPAWNPRRAELRLSTSDGGESVLHAFDRPSDPDRCMLPEGAPACDVSGDVALGLGDLRPGEILLVETRLRRDILLRAKRAGAVAVVSAGLNGYNLDPTGRERHRDAIHFWDLGSGVGLPVAQISPRSYQLIVDAQSAGTARLSLVAEVDQGETSTRTIVATVVGDSRPQEVVALSSHLEAPGASDNASGAAGQLENALSLVRVLDAGGLPWPQRSLAFIWGMENEEAELWLESQERTPVAAVNAVMIGESRAETGALPLLERYPDPGAVTTILPDKHTLWGSRDIEPEWLVPNGLSIVARCALVDVAEHVGGWETFENPYEGGTDHERFIESGVPAVLFWHFTDFTFHTSLDRVEMIDSLELRRMATAALTTAMAMADPEAGDLTRYLRSLDHERSLRISAAQGAGDAAIEADWRTWCNGVRHWFRVHCLGLDRSELPGPMETAEEL